MKILLNINLIRWLIGIFLISPYLIIFYYTPSYQNINWMNFKQVILNTFIQAILSSFFTFTIGFFGALGIITIKNKTHRILLESILIFPIIVPVIFIVSPFLILSSQIGLIPYGYWGIISVHVLIFTGITSITIANLIESKLGEQIELCWIEGAKRYSIIVEVIKWLKKDFLILSFFIFVNCFASFSVPLMVGGSRGITIEVLIYEVIRLDGDWNQATFLSIIQLFFLLSFGLFVKERKWPKSKKTFNLTKISMLPGMFIPITFSGIILSGLLSGLFTGKNQLIEINSLIHQLPILIINSLLIAFATGICILVLLSLITFTGIHSKFDKFLMGLSTPSTVLIGFSILLLNIFNGIEMYFGLSICLCATFLTSLYRLQLRTGLNEIHSQILSAKTLGASNWLIFSKISYPLLKKRIWFLSGLGAFWAIGDYALSDLLLQGPNTLALLIKSYLNSYRWELAATLNLVLMFMGILVLLIFWGIGSVDSKKFD